MSAAALETGAECAREKPRLRVFFITEDDPIYVVNFFEVLLAEYPSAEIEICGMTISRAFNEPLWKTGNRLLHFYGPLGTLRMARRFLHAKLGNRSIRTLARQAGIPLFDTDSVNGSEYLDRLRALDPDLVVSVAAPEIFRKRLLALPRLGCINIHSGGLPAYRGMMPVFWQMKNGEDRVTISVHEMVRKLDAGALLGVREFPLREKDSLDRVIRDTKCEGARLMVEVLAQVRRGEHERRPLELDGTPCFSFPKRADVRVFKERGHRLL